MGYIYGVGSFTGNRFLLEIYGIHLGYIWDTYGIYGKFLSHYFQ